MNVSKKALLNLLFFRMKIVVILFAILILFTLRSYGLSQQHPKLEIPKDWKTYRNEVLGIEFSYPKECEDVVPHLRGEDEDLTDLACIDNSRVVELSVCDAKILIFGEGYKGLESGLANPSNHPYDNIETLRVTGDICKYAINFEGQVNNGIASTEKEVGGSCVDGIKGAIIQEKQSFGPERLLYEYDLNLYGYKKIKNGYLNHVIIISNLARSDQIKDATMTIEDLLSSHEPPISLENYEHLRRNFAKIVGSIRSFKPPLREKPSFQIIPDEDPNITAIRRYYFTLTSGDLKSAYDFLPQNRMPFDRFETIYNCIYRANPDNFEKIEDGRYRFSLDYQGGNTTPKKYRVTMDIHNGKLSLNLIEYFIGKVVKFENLSAFAEIRNGNSVIVLYDGKKEEIIDSADCFWESFPAPDFIDAIFGLSSDSFCPRNGFAGVDKFSPQGKRSIYTRRVHYGEAIDWIVYDIKTRKYIKDLASTNPKFIGENYMYVCNGDIPGSTCTPPTGRVYNFSDMNLEFDIFGSNKNEGYNEMVCSYDENKNSIVFTLSADYKVKEVGTCMDIDYELPPEKSNTKKIVEYSLTNKKVQVSYQ